MEYLLLFGGNLEETLSRILGEHAEFILNKAAPIGLAVLWLACLYGLLVTWFGHADSQEERRGWVGRLFFSLILLIVLTLSGSAFEFLVLGGEHIHSRVLAGLLDLIASLRSAV